MGIFFLILPIWTLYFPEIICFFHIGNYCIILPLFFEFAGYFGYLFFYMPLIFYSCKFLAVKRATGTIIFVYAIGFSFTPKKIPS